MKFIMFFIAISFSLCAFSMDRAVESSQRLMKTLEVKVVAGTNASTETILSQSYDTTDAKVATTTDSFEGANSFELCDRVRLTGSSTPTIPTGLSADLDYFVIVNSATSISLATTCALATAGTKVDITAVGAGTIEVSSVEFKTNAEHGFITGDRVTVSTGGSLPTGLSAGNYWVIKDSIYKFRLASTLANALAGTAVEWTDAIGEDQGTDVIATATEKLSGPAANRFSMQVQATGIYKLTFKDSGLFASADQIIALAASNEVAKNAAATTINVGYITVTVETAASGADVDGAFSLLVIGSKTANRY